jgi:hypothetical protein
MAEVDLTSNIFWISEISARNVDNSAVVRHRDIGKRWKTKNSKVVLCKCTTVELFEQTTEG